MKLHAVVGLLLLTACVSYAEELPDAPTPKIERKVSVEVIKSTSKEPVRQVKFDTSLVAKIHWASTGFDYATTGLFMHECHDLPGYPPGYLAHYCKEADPLARPALGRHPQDWRLALSFVGESAAVSSIPNKKIRRIVQISLITSHVVCGAWNLKNWH